MMQAASSVDVECVVWYGGVMRTTIDVPEPLLENAKKRAAELRVTLSVVVQDALRSHLVFRSAPAGQKFRLHTVRGRLVRPDLDLDRTSALVTLDDESAYSGGKV
jgi:hypothetical protein